MFVNGEPTKLKGAYIEQMAEARINPGVGYAVGDKNGLYHTHYTFGHFAYNRGKYFEFEGNPRRL